jgi:hypothetical protein
MNMARLPVPGSDEDSWGDLLNAFLRVSHREDGVLRGVVEAANVKDFGAAGDGGQNDAGAIQVALDSGKNVYFPPGNYRVDQPLIVQHARQLIFGLGGMREGNDNTSNLVARLFTRMENGAIFKVESHMVTFMGLYLEGPGRKTEETPNRDIAAIEFRKRSNTDDVDGRVLECVLRQLATGIRVVGRGLRAERNVFVSTTEGIQLDWPAAGVERDEVGDPLGLQDLPYGMRSFVITNNRVHACSTFLVNEALLSQHRLWGLVFTNNLIDVGDALFRGGATYSTISHNVIAHCNKTIIAFNGACHHTVIAGNVLSGHDERTEKQPTFGIWFTNNCHDLTIANNTFVNIKSHALLFEADRQNYITIQGNSFDNIGTDNQSANVIRFAKPAGDFAISGNTFKPGGSDRVIIGANGIPLSGFEVQANAYQRNATLISDYIDGGFNTIQR